MAKNKTWRLAYPDGTESIMNYDPIKHEKDKHAKETSSLTKDINRLRKVCVKYEKINNLRKMQHRQTSKFMDFLLKEKRTTKKELAKFFKKKSYAIQGLGEKNG